MRRSMQSKDVPGGKRAQAVPLDDDGRIWGVIFTTTALVALGLAVLFSVAAG